MKNSIKVVEQMALIDQIAKDENVGVLDAHTPTVGHDKFYHDGGHPGTKRCRPHRKGG